MTGLRTETTLNSSLHADFEKNLALKLKLCAALEDLADRLPYGVGDDHCLTLAKSLLPILKRAQELEEQQIFPHLRQCYQSDETLPPTLARLEGEHCEDEAFAEELSEHLIAFVQDRKSGNPDLIAYMLRGFFESLRRHIAFEREHLLPLMSEPNLPENPKP